MKPPMQLSDLIGEWLGTHLTLKDHIEVEPANEGLFLLMTCFSTNIKIADEIEKIPIAFITNKRQPHGWTHHLNPADPQYFEKLEKFIVEIHNSARSAGCGKFV